MNNPFADRLRRSPYVDNPFAIVRLPPNTTDARAIARRLEQAKDVAEPEERQNVSWAQDILSDPNRRIVYAILCHPVAEQDHGGLAALAGQLEKLIVEPSAQTKLQLALPALAKVALAILESPRSTQAALVPLGARFAPDERWVIRRFALENLA